MTQKNIFECDGCGNEVEQYGDDIMSENEILSKGWIIVPQDFDQNTHYCKMCAPQVKRELDESGVEYID